MKLRRIKIDDIKVPEVRVTARMDEETSEQFAESVKAIGVDEPPKVYEVDGVYYLSDGLHRLNEAKRLGDKDIDVLVRPGTMVDVIANNLMSGHLRGKHPVSEMVRSIRLLYVDHKMSIEEIVKKTGLTQAYVEKLIVISELTPLILANLDEGRITPGQAFELTRIPDPVIQEAIFYQVRQAGWKGKELHDYISDTLGIAATKVQPAPTTEQIIPAVIHCAYCGAEGKPGQITNPNTCPECARIMYQSIVEANRQLAAEAAAQKNTPGG